MRRTGQWSEPRFARSLTFEPFVHFSHPHPVKLAGYIGQLNNFTVFRDLTEDELKNHQSFASVVGEARNRLKLFRILDRNYQEWTNYLSSLLTTNRGDHDDEMLHLDRLLL